MKKFSPFLIILMLMLASFTAGMEYQRGDVDLDGQVSISDVSCLIDYLLYGTWPDEPVTPPDNHEWVDLGLPSGTLWATCNIGANAPEEFGDYFAWGETEPKEIYDWSTYKWSNGTINTLTKYCINSDYGTVDNKTELDPEDDAAYVNWGPSWRMPTNDQLGELYSKCTWIWWTTSDGVNGQLVFGPNGASLFLPAAGYRENTLLKSAGSQGVYWSPALNSNSYNTTYDAYYLNFFSVGVYWGSQTLRSNGLTVRAVRVSQD